MSFGEQVAARATTIGEVFAFLWQRRLWWLIPVAALIFVIGLLLLLAHVSAAAPWMYPL